MKTISMPYEEYTKELGKHYKDGMAIGISDIAASLVIFLELPKAKKHAEMGKLLTTYSGMPDVCKDLKYIYGLTYGANFTE